MGLFGNKNKESVEEIDNKIRNSEAGKLFATAFKEMFSVGGEYYQWLMVDTKDRSVALHAFKDGVQLEKLNFNRLNYKNTGTYTVDKHGWGFGASGYADLPDNKYVDRFYWFLKEQIETCPNIIIRNGHIKLEETAKKGW